MCSYLGAIFSVGSVEILVLASYEVGKYSTELRSK